MPLKLCLSLTRPNTEHYRSRVITCKFCFLNQAILNQPELPKPTVWNPHLCSNATGFIRNHVSK